MGKLLALAGLGLLGCQALPTDAPPSRDIQPLLAATTTTTSTVSPISLGVFVSCALGGAGELVLVTGELHVVVHQSTSESGNTTAKVHFQPQGLAGAGVTSGDRFQATGVTQQTTTVSGNPPWNTTYVNNFRFIGQGPGNNYMVHQTYHVTVNPDGTVTALVDHLSVTCN
jgi:hypothetical protein